MASNPNTHAILDAYAEYTGDNNIYKMGRVRQAAKNLANYGLQPGEVPALMDWLRAQPWVKGVDLILAQTMYLRWRDDTKPRSIEEQIAEVRASNDPRYLGSQGAQLRQYDLARLEGRLG